MSKNKVHAFCHSQNITEIQSSAQTSYKGPSKGLKGLVHITHKEDMTSIAMPWQEFFFFFHHAQFQKPITTPQRLLTRRSKLDFLFICSSYNYWNPRNGFCLRACSGMSFCIISSVAPFNSESIKKQHPLWVDILEFFTAPNTSKLYKNTVS